MTGFKIQAWLLTAAFVLAAGDIQAQAPTKAQQDAIRSNCRSDYMKNCSSVTPGGREALECLMKNKANVSGGCQGALNAVSAPPPAAEKPEPKGAPSVPPPAAAAPQAPEAPKAPPPAAAKPAAPKAAKAPAKPTAPSPAEAAPPPPATAAAPPPADAAPRPMRIGEAIMIRRFCATDFKVLCKGVPIGQGRAVKCLTDNKESLSPGCKQAMADTGH